MTNLINRAQLLGLGNLLSGSSSTSTSAPASSSGIITLDQLISAPDAQGTYVQNNLVRAKNLGTPYPVAPTITLKQFVDELVGALAELFRARGYERIADYLLSQHDLESVFGQLATRMLQMHQETQERESLIAKYLRINAGSSDLLTENQVDLAYSDSSSSVTSMSSGQLGELNNILTGYSDGTGSHEGLNAVSQSITNVTVQPTQDALAQLATTAEFLDPDNAQIQAGLTAASSIAKTMQSNTNLTLIQNPQANTQGYTDTASLLSIAQAGSTSAATYSQSTFTSTLADLTNNVVAPNTAGTQPLYPPLYAAGQNYTADAFVTYGSEVYQCVGSTTGSPITDPTNWLDTGCQPVGGAYQMSSLTQTVNDDVKYLQTNGQTDYVAGANYSVGQNVSYNGQTYYKIADSSADTNNNSATQQIQAGTYRDGDMATINGENYQYFPQSNFTPPATVYNPLESYKAGDYVSYNGQIYQIQSDINAPAAFNNDHQYNSGDAVVYNGQVYEKKSGVPNDSVTFASAGSFFSPSKKTVITDSSDDSDYSSDYSTSISYTVSTIKFSSPNVLVGVKYSNGYTDTIDSSSKWYSNLVSVDSHTQIKSPDQNSDFEAIEPPNLDANFALYTPPIDQPIKFVNYQDGASYNAGDIIIFKDAYYMASNSGNFYTNKIPLAPLFDNTQLYTYGEEVVYGDNLYIRNNSPDPYITLCFKVGSDWNRLNIVPGQVPAGGYTFPPGDFDLAKTEKNMGAFDKLCVKYKDGTTGLITVESFATQINSIDCVLYGTAATPDISYDFMGAGQGYNTTVYDPTNLPGFSIYNPSLDASRWTLPSPASDTTHWTAGISPALTQAQSDLQSALTLLQSLFDTSSTVAGTRQDFLSITGSMPQDGSTPAVKTFSIQQAESFELQQKQNYLTAMTNLLNQSPPNFSQVRTNAATLQSQIKSQISSTSQQDPNQQWGAILQSLATLINQCNNGDQAGALTTLGTVVTPPSANGDGTDSSSANAAMSGNPPATLQVEFLIQYSMLSPTDIGDTFAQSVGTDGKANLSNSPYLGTLQKLQAFQQLVQRVNSGDTSEPAAQMFNEMQNALQDLYDSQSLTGTPIFSQADYAAAQTHLAHAMLTRGNGGINIALSLAQVEALPNSDARKGTLLGLYRDMFKAMGDINDFNAVNNYVGGQNPPPAGQGTGYLAQVAGDMGSLSSSASGISTPETGHQQRRRLLSFWGLPFGIQRSRKFTSGDSFTSLKNTYDNLKAQLSTMMTSMNTDLTFAANQYVGDVYSAPPAGQSTPAAQRVVYNGQFYKSLTTTSDRPDVGASKQPPTWELMTFNANRGRTYQFGDVVTYNGQMYRCIDSNMPSASDPSTIPGTTFSRNNWAQISYQTGYHYLAGDTVLVQQNGQYIPYVAKVEYTAGDSSDLNNPALWTVGYNNAVSVNAAGQIQAAATLGGMTAIVNGGSTQFNGNITASQLYSQYGNNVNQGTVFSTILDSRNGAVGAGFNGWVSDNSQFLNSATAGGTATSYDGMQFYNPAMQTATTLMQTLQMIDLFFYAHQQFTISGGGNYYTGYTAPIVSLTWGASDEGGSNAYNSIVNPQIFDASAAGQVFGVTSDHNMGNTTSSGWRDAEDGVTTSFYQASRSLASQLKSQVTSFQNNFNTMKLQVQQEAYRLLSKAFVNTTDIQASLTQLFRNAPLTDDEKKLLAKILAVVMSLLIAILGANPQIRAAFTQQTVVTGKSSTGQNLTSSQWVFNDALSSVRIDQSFANNLIAKAIALADQLLSEKKRSSSVSDDRLSTNDYLNMQAFAEGQKEALENLDAQNSQAKQRI